MFRQFFVFVIPAAFFCFLYGVFNIFLEVEENACRMTYMFGHPQFSKINFNENIIFPNYGLYYYSEGYYVKDANGIELNGAPVIFIPGNGGSHKQARSLASVALRKGMDNKHGIHLDYFTIDYNDELSGLYGGYLSNQKEFLKICIKTVLKLYKNVQHRSKVVLIGHSMGGKVAQAILSDSDIVKAINTIIFVSSPLDNPVMNFDLEINSFYKEINEFLSHTRIPFIPNNTTNTCCNLHDVASNVRHHENVRTELENVLLISIGGGNRDLLVRAGLTTSQFSDIHAMSSSIPNVWLSCDHLSAVWCLQLVLVINRFLFSISTKYDKNYISFNEDKVMRMQTASNFFVKPQTRQKTHDIDFRTKFENDNVWRVDSKRVFKREFKNGLKRTYNQMIQLAKYQQFKKMYVEVFHLDEKYWIYGCVSKAISQGKYICEKGTSLSHYIQNIPSNNIIRSMAILDLHNIRKTYTNWTDIDLRLPSTNKPIYFNVDIHDPKERSIYLKAPRWFLFNKKYLINETVQGTIYYKILIQDLIEPTQGLKINIEATTCSSNSYYVTTKICIPWAKGFNRYNVLSENTGAGSFYVNVPIPAPPGYNTTKNPVVLEIYLDSVCRYGISYQFSIADTMSRIVQQFAHWFPSHLTAVLCIVLKNQVSKLYLLDSLKTVKPYTGFFQFTSVYIITGCRIFKKLLDPIGILPMADMPNYTFYLSFIVHGTAVVMSILLSFAVWVILTLHGNAISTVAFRLIRIPFGTSSVMLSIMTSLPLAFGFLSVSIAIGCCGGIALILACVFYFLMISNAYKDYMENMIWESATNLLKRYRRKLSSKSSSDLPDITSENSLNGDSAIENEREPNCLEEPSQNQNIDSNRNEGLDYFSFHTTMLILLIVLTSLNFGVTMAWIKNYRYKHSLPDPSLVPSIITLSCLSLLLQFKAPKQFSFFRFGYMGISLLLYVSASACVMYCQEAVYRLNYIIAFVYVIILLQEIIGRTWRYYIIKNNAEESSAIENLM